MFRCFVGVSVGLLTHSVLINARQKLKGVLMDLTPGVWVFMGSTLGIEGLLLSTERGFPKKPVSRKPGT